MWTVRMTERKLLMTHPELSLADSNLAKQEQKMQNAHSHKMMMIIIILLLTLFTCQTLSSKSAYSALSAPRVKQDVRQDCGFW